MNVGSSVGKNNSLLTVRHATLKTTTSFMYRATEAVKLSACIDGPPNAAWDLRYRVHLMVLESAIGVLAFVVHIYLRR